MKKTESDVPAVNLLIVPNVDGPWSATLVKSAIPLCCPFPVASR